MFELIAAVMFAVIISAACSVFEAVLYSVPATHIEGMAQARRRSGLILQRFRRDIDRPIAGILSLNTIANTAGAAVAGAYAARVFGADSVILFSAVFTLTILVVSEVIPKTVGVVYSKRLASWIAMPLQVVVWLMTPMIWICRLATRLVPRNTPEHAFTDQELLSMLRMGEKAGALDADEAQRIRNILSLETKTVTDIMTPRTVCLTAGARLTMRDLRERAARWQHSRVPVWDKSPEDIVGLAHRRDVLVAIGEDRWDTTLADLMRPVDFILTIHPLDTLLDRFLETKQHLLVVLDELGGLAGVVTLEDLMEEILGEEIVDEFDQITDLRRLAHDRRERTLHRQQGT